MFPLGIMFEPLSSFNEEFNHSNDHRGTDKLLESKYLEFDVKEWNFKSKSESDFE